MGSFGVAPELLALQRPYVGGLGALRPLGDVELDGLPLLERAVAGRLDRAEVHEDVRAGLRRNEAIALFGVEPLDGSDGHELVPPSVVSEVSNQRRHALVPAARDKLDPRI